MRLARTSLPLLLAASALAQDAAPETQHFSYPSEHFSIDVPPGLKEVPPSIAPTIPLLATVTGGAASKFQHLYFSPPGPQKGFFLAAIMLAAEQPRDGVLGNIPVLRAFMEEQFRKATELSGGAVKNTSGVAFV